MNNQAFNLSDDDAYRQWREQKLAGFPARVEDLFIRVADPGHLTSVEIDKIRRTVRLSNVAIFQSTQSLASPVESLTRLGSQLGLSQLNNNLCAEESGISALTVKQTTTDKQYIPYTNKPLSWHTDGYYNSPEEQIRAWLLYCKQDAAEGGENEILDHEIVYIRLRDENPELIRALMQPNAFTIPANIEAGEEIRSDQSGPVFSVMPDNGQLHMRYSARKRNVIWHDDPLTKAAAEFLTDLFSAGDDHIFRYRLQPGEGLISNNVLHRREGFTDDAKSGRKRLIYRARYYQRIAGT